MAQDNWKDDYSFFRNELKKINEELQLLPYCLVTIELDGIKVYQYDYPREIINRHENIIRWREAKIRCSHPFADIRVYHCYYDKHFPPKSKYQEELEYMIKLILRYRRQEKLLQEYESHLNGCLFDPNEEKKKIIMERLEQLKHIIDTSISNYYNKIDYGKD